MNSNQLPRTVTYNGRTLVAAGPGNSPQGVLYFDPSQQRLQEFFIGTVKTSGELYAVASVEGNPRLNRVRIDLGAVVGGLRVSVVEAEGCSAAAHTTEAFSVRVPEPRLVMVTDCALDSLNTLFW